MLTDNGCSRRRPRHCLCPNRYPESIGRLGSVAGKMVISETRGRGEGREGESVISSRRSIHRPVRLMEPFGTCENFHPRNRRYTQLTRAVGASVARMQTEERSRQQPWTCPWVPSRINRDQSRSRSVPSPTSRGTRPYLLLG